MLDSISKDDLQKILRKLHGDKLKAEVENWFDTVMQGFDERYTRHMKTVALIVSFAVVIVLNANFFDIYRNIADSDIRRADILQKGQTLSDRLKAQEAAQTQPSTTPARTPAATPVETSNASPGASPVGTPKPVTTEASGQAKQTTEQIKEDIKKNAQEMQQYINEYKGFGFTPLRRHEVVDFLWSQGYWEGQPFHAKFLHAMRVILGWTIMALLLSVGAPFWQDTLESLFGLKGLIRKKSQTQNVEARSGEGQPKP